MHKTYCMQSIENSSIWEVFSSICPKVSVASQILAHLYNHANVCLFGINSFKVVAY